MLAGLLANKMFGGEDEEEAKKQQIASMRMQMAQRLSPDMPTFGFQGAQFKHQMDQRQDEGQRQLMASLVPMAIAGMDELSAAPDSTRGFTSANNDRLAQMFSAQAPALPQHPFRGLDGSEDW
jgi:hypothetical protein